MIVFIMFGILVYSLTIVVEMVVETVEHIRGAK